MKFINSIVISLSAISLAVPAYSQLKPKSSSIESVIDKLERKLIEESGERISIYDATRKSNDKIDLQGTEIVDSKLNEIKSISALESEIYTLENSLSKVSDEIAKTSQSLLAKANKDTSSVITINLSKLDKFNLKKMEVTLDGFSLFKFDSAYHVTLPMKNIPLYDGPISTGNHNIHIKASFNKKTSDEISIESEVYATTNEILKIKIEPSEKHTNFTATLEASDENKINTTISKSTGSQRDLGGEVNNDVAEEKTINTDQIEPTSTKRAETKSATEENLEKDSDKEEIAKDIKDSVENLTKSEQDSGEKKVATEQKKNEKELPKVE
jgi:hypothetical protein